MSHLPEDAYDVRKLERAVAEGVLTPDQVDAWLASLEDCAADADESNVRMVSHERGGRTATLGEEGPHEEEEG